MVQTPATTSYMLDNAWREARQRLGLIEEVLDPWTIRHLEGVGIGPGWRCAELGAGGGSIARWLCSRVGPQGRVVAVDLDTRFLEGGGEPTLEVRQADLTETDLEAGAFDLIHARALLMHIPGRADLLERMVAALRPGGWLLIEEPDFYPLAAITAGVYRETWAAMGEELVAAGGVIDWARELPGILDRHALEDVAADQMVMTFRGASACARLVRLTVEQLRARLVNSGRIGADVIDAAFAELDRPELWFTGMAIIAAWGRR